MHAFPAHESQHGIKFLFDFVVIIELKVFPVFLILSLTTLTHRKQNGLELKSTEANRAITIKEIL